MREDGVRVSRWRGENIGLLVRVVQTSLPQSSEFICEQGTFPLLST